MWITSKSKVVCLICVSYEGLPKRNLNQRRQTIHTMLSRLLMLLQHLMLFQRIVTSQDQLVMACVLSWRPRWDSMVFWARWRRQASGEKRWKSSLTTCASTSWRYTATQRLHFHAKLTVDTLDELLPIYQKDLKVQRRAWETLMTIKKRWQDMRVKWSSHPQEASKWYQNQEAQESPSSMHLRVSRMMACRIKRMLI